jgi:hypothetical protein
VHERNNRWALYSALVRGIDKVRLIAVWDGKNEPSHDLDTRLVKHMIDLMRDTGGMIEQVNPLKLPAIHPELEPTELEQPKPVAAIPMPAKPKNKPAAKPKKK